MCNYGRAVSSRLLTYYRRANVIVLEVLYYWYSLFNIPFGHWLDCMNPSIFAFLGQV